MKMPPSIAGTKLLNRNREKRSKPSERLMTEIDLVNRIFKLSLLSFKRM